MLKRAIGVVVAAMLMSVAGIAEEKKTVRGKRMENQQKRIKEGVKDDSLTTKEAIKLEAKEAKLAREARRDRKDGGGMTAKEKVKIDHKQDKLSKEIYKEKHDAQTKKQ